jgi:hypothetical protein
MVALGKIGLRGPYNLAKSLFMALIFNNKIKQKMMINKLIQQLKVRLNFWIVIRLV